MWRAGVSGPSGVRKELASAAPPGPGGEALKSAVIGALGGPKGFAGATAMGAANQATAQSAYNQINTPMSEEERMRFRAMGVDI